ncbi:hypothetical protein D9M72_652480 [compost metagenome]
MWRSLLAASMTARSVAYRVATISAGVWLTSSVKTVGFSSPWARSVYTPVPLVRMNFFPVPAKADRKTWVDSA